MAGGDQRGREGGATDGGRLVRAADLARERLWIWPVAAAVAGAAAAEGLVRLDRSLERGDSSPLWVFSGDADAARSVLTTIATATMTVLGVTLTITLAVFALTAQGYSPRVLRRFMRDGIVQAVVAVFIGTFVFALVALRLVREDEIPGVTVTVAVALTLVALGLLVGFFHHMASEIRVERIVDAVWDETRRAVDAGLREPASSDDAEPVATPLAATVQARSSGRVRWIDESALADVARATGGTVVLVPGPGDFLAEGEPVARMHGGRAPVEAERARVAGAVSTGTQRTMPQDVAFGLRQLTDMALRALSPSLNDPTTAEEAVLRGSDLLRRIADRRLGSRVLEEGRPLVVRDRPTWDELVGLVFDQVAAEAELQADAATARMLLDAIGRVMASTPDPARLEPLRARARRVRDGARRAIHEPSELERIEAAAARLA
jgi:uncharacterized membrane protein